MTAGADPWSQAAHRVRFDWGHEAARRFGASCRIVVVVDVLSFTTAVAVAVERGASVVPFAGGPEDAERYAAELGAVAASRVRGAGPSLSPASLLGLAPGSRLVLPSPNGAVCCSLAAEGGATVIAGTLRGRTAAVTWLRDAVAAGASPVGVVAAGERWPNGTLRPALEDLVGAGALLEGLDRAWLSPEARVAVGAWSAVASDLDATIAGSASGVELAGRGFADDVRLASELDVSDVLPVLRGAAFTAAPATGD